MKVGRAERLFLGLGLLLILAWGGIRLHSWLSSRSAVRGFRRAVEETKPVVLPPEGAETSAGVTVPMGTPDTSLWGEGRVRKYRESLEQDAGKAIAVLSIPSIGLTVPVFEGTGPITLNRGAGRIPGTAHPGEPGNLGIAGHRDGFFRGLKDVAPGDTIDLETARGTLKYVIRWVKIVDPKDVSVLAPSKTRELTLVTCYPFYFVGKAPRRYIVRAGLADGNPAEDSGSEGRPRPAGDGQEDGRSRRTRGGSQ